MHAPSGRLALVAPLAIPYTCTDATRPRADGKREQRGPGTWSGSARTQGAGDGSLRARATYELSHLVYDWMV